MSKTGQGQILQPTDKSVQAVTVLGEALDYANVWHKHLYKAQDANNYAYTDGEYVWIKLARYIDSPDRQLAELAAVEKALDVGVPTVQPILSEPLQVGDRWATVWFHVPDNTHLRADEWTPQLVQQIWKQAQTLHNTTAPPNIPKAGGLTEKVYDRIVETNTTSVAADILLELCSLISERWDAIVSTNVDNETAVWCHGDLHSGNVLFSDSQAFLIDWESTVMAPPEWDIAGMRHNIVRIGGQTDVWETMAQTLTGYDQETIMLAEQVKAVSGVSYLLQFDDTTPVISQRLAALRDYVPWGEMPSRLAPYI